MKEYKKPLVEVHELRVTENIAASGKEQVKAKWVRESGRVDTTYTNMVSLTSVTE